MALTTTTVSAAVGQLDTFITVASATSIQPNMMGRMNGEWFKVAQNYVSGTSVPVIRGQDGSAQVAHAVTSNFTFGTANDFNLANQAPAGVADAVTDPAQPAFPLKAYGAAGAIDVRQHIAIINGTSALAMTLANPTKDMDGQFLFIVANGKAAHTLTYTAGFGNAGGSYDVITFVTGGQACVFAIACNGIWCLVGQLTGTLTAIAGAIA